ncbi:MAG TPA: TolC family protein, partial [Pyrinomonadaceae bacterium]|nr:TolC family protein [Pyrinomonadaceae bacterium]
MCIRNSLLALALLLLVGIVSGWCQQTSSGPDEVLTLDQAVALALRENHSVRDAELEAGKTGDIVAATRTHRLPAMNFYSLAADQFLKQEVVNIGGLVPNIFPGVGPFFSIGIPRRPTAVIAGLILQPISQQYRLGLDVEEAKLARNNATERLRLLKQSTIDRVKQTYYGILQTQSALESTQQAITSYRELERVTSDKVTQQVSLRNASLDVRTRLAKAEYEAINLSNELATKKEQLNDLLGRDVRIEFRVNPAPNVGGFPADLESARTRALEQRPEVREARLKIQQAEVDRRIKKSEYIPDVSAGFVYMTFRNFDEFVPKNLASAGVAIKWEVFDWGRKRDELAAKDKTIEQEKTRLREAESRVLIDVSDKFRKLQQTRQALVVAQLAEQTAQETLRINTNRYKLTAALLSDVLQSQSTLAEANHDFQQALLGYWTAQAEFEKALGEDN